MQTIQLVPILEANGQIVWQDAHGEQYETVSGLGSFWATHASQGISEALKSQQSQKGPGIFAKGGFFDNLIKGNNGGIFRKKDGSNTVIGDTLNTFATSFGQRLGDRVVQPTQPMDMPTFPNFNAGNLQPRDPDYNGPPEDPKDKTLMYVGIGGGVLFVSGLLWYAWSQSQKKKGNAKK